MVHDPHKKTREEITAYFEENQSDFPGVAARLEEFFAEPNLASARALLSSYFQSHQEGDDNSFRKITAAFADKRAVKQIVDSVLADEEALQEIASQSYPHPIGFDKLVLYHHQPEDANRKNEGYKFRLHMYWRSPQEVAMERTHLHKFEMASAPITGELTNHRWRVTEFDNETGVIDGLTTSPERPEGESRVMYAYTGYQRDSDGSLHKRYMGRATLQHAGSHTFVPGQTYAAVMDDGHYVETNAETGHTNGDFCSTIYIHGPSLEDTEGRRVPVLFEEERLAQDDTVISTILNMTVDDLKQSLERYSRVLGESIDFYDWLYDEKYGRNLSVGMVAGYLLSEIAGNPNTLEFWQTHYAESKKILDDCSVKLTQLVSGEIDIKDLPEADRTTRYWQQLMNKAQQHPAGAEDWLQEFGDLKKEMWRYSGALIGDYARNPDIRTLKPIWDLNNAELQGGAHYGHISAMLEAAFAAGDIALSYFRSDALVATQKEDGQGPVTQADLEAQQKIQDILSEHFPDYGFVGEEGSEHAEPPEDGDKRWLVDPIDGTTNFSKGNKDFAISIACQEFQNGEWATIDAVVSMPAHQEIFWAEKGQGAYFIDAKGEEKKIATFKDLPPEQMGLLKASDVIKGSIVEFSTRGLGDGQPKFIENLMNAEAKLRAHGSAAAMLAKVSGYGNDAVVVTGENYDVAAGMLIAEEAGAAIRELSFEREGRDYTAYVAANSPALARALEQEVKKVIPQQKHLHAAR